MIFLDSASGTKPYPEVIETITDVLTNHWGNASADYSFGHQSLNIIEQVRTQIAEDINCSPEEIIFTSGACEANTLAINGFLKQHKDYAIYTTKLEHSSILNLCENINTCYAIIPDKYGTISPINVSYMTPPIFSLFCDDEYFDNQFLSLHAANGEIGTIQDVVEIGKRFHKGEDPDWRNKILHIDATQLYPEQRIDVQEAKIDLMSVSAQKFHGPRGVGFLYVRNGIELAPIIFGTQEKNIRGGTYNVAAIAGMGKALEITRTSNKNLYVKALRDKLLNTLLTISGAHLNGPDVDKNRLVNNISLTIDGVDADQLVAMCDAQGIMIAKGSACQSYNPIPSKTLLAIGLTEEQALSTIRISLDEFNTEEEINYVCEMLPKIITRLRAI